MRQYTPTTARHIPKEAKRAFKGIIFDVYQWQQKMFDGTYETFEMLRRPDTVQIIAIKDGKIVFLQQEQPDIAKIFWELPGGRHDHEEETELEAAKRELLEETGMTFSDWKLIGANVPHHKIDWVVYFFLATGYISQTEQSLDVGEKITVTLKTLEEVQELLFTPPARSAGKDFLKNIRSIEELVALPNLDA